MVAVRTVSGTYVAFDPTRLKSLAGNHATVSRSAGWAEAVDASSDDEKTYLHLKYALTFAEPTMRAQFMVTKATDFEVARILPAPPLLDAGPGVNRKEWTGSVLNTMGGFGQPVVQVAIETRKNAPKKKYNSLAVHLVNRGSTGLERELEAAFMDALVAARSKGSWKVFQTPPDSAGEGAVLDMNLRLEDSASFSNHIVIVAYNAVERASGEVVARGFGRGVIGKKVDKDIRSLAESCWVPDQPK